MNKYIVHPQAERFIRSLAPGPRSQLVRAIKALPKGDIKALEGRLDGYFRLRVGGCRVIYEDSMKKGVRTFDCVFAERRSIVYELFEQILVEQALNDR